MSDHLEQYPAWNHTLDEHRWTIHFDNVSSRRSEKRHGNGRLWLMMCRPRAFERAAAFGSVYKLTPSEEEWTRLEHSDSLDAAAEYRSSYIDRALSHLHSGQLEPYKLLGQLKNRRWGFVLSGDTLCCSCSTDTAAQGWCHRVWAAEVMTCSPRWRVVLDGRALNPVEGEGPVIYRSDVEARRSITKTRRKKKRSKIRGRDGQIGLFDDLGFAENQRSAA